MQISSVNEALQEANHKFSEENKALAARVDELEGPYQKVMTPEEYTRFLALGHRHRAKHVYGVVDSPDSLEVQVWYEAEDWFSNPTEANELCSCELQNRRWNPTTRSCEACGTKY